MSYSNFFHLTRNKFEECNSHDYLAFQCVEQQSRSAFSSSLQYHLQFQSKLPSFLHNSNCFQTCCIRIDFSAIEVECPQNSLTLNDGHLRNGQE
ncbi:hypothetical protein T05_3012 [Trichinella murrelli]|uniref:Uncharacterized protein n=1 Tax=Trichinella murrelli TaxID=144512 RepID=A0A0V0T651_9BILA|nr:hypothetical protein T05_3012 [Trichinella murrelli]